MIRSSLGDDYTDLSPPMQPVDLVERRLSLKNNSFGMRCASSEPGGRVAARPEPGISWFETMGEAVVGFSTRTRSLSRQQLDMRNSGGALAPA